MNPRPRPSQPSTSTHPSSNVGQRPGPHDHQYAQLHLEPPLGVHPHWTVEGILGQASGAPSAPPQAPLPAQILTIYMQDHRLETENPDHLLSELPIQLHKDNNDQWWVNADDMIRRLQATPGRIDGSAKVSISRGIYRQPFCRLSTTSIEKCHPENLRVSPDHSIEIIIESYAVAIAAADASASSSGHQSAKRQNTIEDEVGGPQMTRSSKRSKASDPHNSAEEITPVVSPAIAHALPSTYASNSLYDMNQSYVIHQSPLVTPAPSSVRGGGSPQPVQPTSPSSSTARKPVLGTGKGVNVKNEIARAAIIPWLQGMMQMEEEYDYFVKSKGRILSISDTLRAYRFARAMLNKYNNTQTPSDLEGAANRKITKVNIWQALDRQTSWGSDAETTLTLVDKYGPGGPEEHPKIADMINGKFGPDEREGSVLFLNHLKRIDGEAKVAKQAAAQAALNAMISH